MYPFHYSVSRISGQSFLLLALATCSIGQLPDVLPNRVSYKKVCDSIASYTDDPHQEFYGSCDFEKDACGWKDSSRDKFRWSLEKANITNIPGVDHTTGTPFGQVMHVAGENSGIFSMAILTFTLSQETALWCQISFWYHLHDPIGISSHFVLSLDTNGLSVILWEIKQGQTNGWLNATLRIGNRPEGSKMVFSINPSGIGNQDVMIDDITLMHCAKGDIPEDSEQLSCDFESNICGWYIDHSASLNWERTNGQKPSYDNQGPGHDQTSGSGYYLFVATKRNSNPSQTARLISYPQQAKCVRFWYHIYGPSIGSLKFIAKSRNGTETVVWTRTGTQGNKWHLASLNFANGGPLQFIFEAILGGTDGSIALDEVQVLSSINGSCPPEPECTFQSSLCGLETDPFADFPWVRITGMQAAGSASPSKDHTFGTDQGYYLSAQQWDRPSGKKSRMIINIFEPSLEAEECWIFWYHMSGRDVGTLNVYLQESHKSQVTLWSRRGDQGERWRPARASVVSPVDPYQIVFEAVAADGPVADIAIDDLSVLNGLCPPYGLCDFEMDMCYWVSNGLGNVAWNWISGASGSNYAPPVDHTTNSNLGHYMAFDTRKSSQEQIAYLQSEVMEPVDRACLEFWYYMNMSPFADKLILTVYVNESGMLHLLWKNTENKEKLWHKITLDYTTTEQYQLVFEATHPRWTAFDSGTVALDDIYIQESVSCADTITTTTVPTSHPTTPPASSMDCNFEDGLCNWVQESEDGFDWTRQQGLQVDTSNKGLLYDHTIGNKHGFYMAFNMSGDNKGETAVLSAAVDIQSLTVCVGFWYFMLGPSVAKLDLVVKMKTTELILWTRNSTEAAEWLKAQVTVSLVDVQKVKFFGSKNAKSRGFIALDDVRVTPGACEDQSPCSFESSALCGFDQQISDSVHWLRVNGSTGHVDHTYQTEMGHSMAVLGKLLLKPDTTHLLTPSYAKTTESCLQFWYWLSAKSGDGLSVHVYLNGELGPALWSLYGGPSTGWKVAEVTLSSPNKFKVAFKAKLSPGQVSFILLDDVSMKNEACLPTGSCDFESGMCTWMNSDSNDHDWFHADGYEGGPLFDHTTRTTDGRFMLSLAQMTSLDNSSKAMLISEKIQPSSKSCLSFWYSVNCSSTGTFRVFLETEHSIQSQIFETSATEHSWRNFSTTVSKTEPYRIILNAESENEGFIAVDDITVTKGHCKDVDVVSGVFLSCQFENDSCEWTDVSVGQFSWERGRNGTASENTGPSVDHTTETELGWYMAVEANNGDQNSYAALQSPAMRQASTDCMLEFYYHMYGEGIGELKVFLQEGVRKTLIWWKSGNHGDKWHRAEVAVGRTHQIFFIVFEATRTFSELGDIAIDDIAFLNCSLPEPQESCPQNTFKCSNRACVAVSRICDFSDDCGDGSDEALCDALAFKQRCSFEQGMCLWEFSEEQARWRLKRGQNAWPQLGPPRDHTRNIAAGHYIIPSSQSQIAEIISSTLLPSFNCTMTFYQFSHGNISAARLTIRLRTLLSGDQDIILWQQNMDDKFHWQRTEVIFSSSVNSKIVFQYDGSGKHFEEYIAVDDVSFSPHCIHDPDNSQLPISPPTGFPTTSLNTPTPTEHPCKENEFYCWRSDGKKCISTMAYCDYKIDCPFGEDEESCGPCTFEYGLCSWSEKSQDNKRWQRVKASEDTEPPNDHTTGSGYYMYLNLSSLQSENEVQFVSPSLPPTSSYCQLLFYVYLCGEDGVRGLRVFIQTEENITQLWTCTNRTEKQWTLVHLPIGIKQQNYRILFSSLNTPVHSSNKAVRHGASIDDISFLNCETSYQPPALSTAGCSFEEDLCRWVQGITGDFYWLRKSGPTETVNTGPAGDHTTGTGYYLYINSSTPDKRGRVAQLKSPVLPPAGENGYCLKIQYHMFGATVGSLNIILHSVESRMSTVVWQRVGSQGNQWHVAQKHVTLQEVHQILIEASAGGEAGDISIDDLSFTEGACAHTDGACDFEDGSCDWAQEVNDDLDWVRGTGNTPVIKFQPSFDHTTNTDSGHYFYLDSSSRVSGQIARMFSPIFTAGSSQCLHLWYYMSGKDTGTLNVYQKYLNGAHFLLLSQSGDHGELWRFAHAPLPYAGLEYRIVVEGINGQREQGTVAVDDVLVSHVPCTAPGHCDFEVNMCGWRNLLAEDDMDWLRNQGNSKAPSTGPSVDHTTYSSTGYYLYVDTTVGRSGDRALLLSEIFPPGNRGQCFTFWYHIYDQHLGTLNLYINSRSLHDNGDILGRLVWTKTGDQGDVWWNTRLNIDQIEPFWFVFEYRKGKASGGDVAIDDVQITYASCYPDLPTTGAPSYISGIGTGVAVAVPVTLLAIAIVCSTLYMLHRRRLNRDSTAEFDDLGRNAVYEFDDCELEESVS